MSFKKTSREAAFFEKISKNSKKSAVTEVFSSVTAVAYQNYI